MPKVSAEHRQAVRDRLLRSARRCLSRKGYEGTTTRDIAAEAGVSIGTLYNYFASKEDLIEALSEDVIAADLGPVVTSGATEADLLGMVRDVVLARPGPGSPVLAQLRGRVSAEANPAVARFNAYIVDAFLPLVKGGQRDGRVRHDADAEALIELIDIVWDGMTRRAAGRTFRTSYERVAAACMQILTGGATDDHD